jgi:hypothetical protein
MPLGGAPALDHLMARTALEKRRGERRRRRDRIQDLQDELAGDGEW